MTNAVWFLLIGLLMLTRGLTMTTLQKLPITSAIIYLIIGFLLGPSVLNLFYFDPLKQSALLEVITELAVLISLFSAGVKMPVPINMLKWQPPIRLATLAMVITIALIATFSYYVLHLPLGAGILLGAVLAPTDPVLATDTQSRYPGDKDQLRFTLTSEAGMNDGAAFPFVMLGLGLLGLHELGELGWRWLVVDVVWATAAAVAIGVALGALIGHMVWKLRGQHQQHDVFDDLVGLGLIAMVYGLCLLVHAWGFLAVFFAAVTLRHTELKLAHQVGINPEPIDPDQMEPALETMSPASSTPAASTQIVSTGALVFKEHLERLSELLLVFLVGGMLLLDYWNWRTLSLAIFVMIVARPVSVLIGLLGTSTSLRVRGITAWFGVRGIGSVYYLMYAIHHGLPELLAKEFIQMTLVVIALSILLHGTSVKPLLHLLWRTRTK